MNGVALVVALTAVGVDYNVQTAEDGKREYVVQMEPELLKSLADGQQIHSAVPPDAGNIERVLIRVGMTAPRHSQVNITAYSRLLVEAGRIASTDGRGGADPAATIFWAAKDKPRLDYNVQYGWQPDTQGVLSYFVQISPVLLGQLAIGDEIRAGVDPAAGKIGKFVIQAGAEQLPKVPVEPVATARTEFGSGRNRVSPAPSTNTGELYPDTNKSVYGPAPIGRGSAGSPPSNVSPGTIGPSTLAPSTIAPLDRAVTPLASTPDYGQFGAGAAEQQQLYSPPARTPTRVGGGVSDLGANLGDPAFGGQSSPPDYAHTQPYTQPHTQPAYNDPRYQQPRGTLEPPPAAYSPPNYAGSAATQPPQFAPQVGYPPANGYAPSSPPDRLASATRPTSTSGTAAPLAAPQINTTSTTKAAESSSSENKPYLTMIVTFALFMSIGANLYLGWTAGEYYSRYRLATERLRSASRA
jgi:hypothetical protein